MTFAEAKVIRDRLEAAVTSTNAMLRAFPTGQMGLTPDHIKSSPEFQSALTAFDLAFQRLRTFNFHFVRTFRREIKAARLSRRAA